MKKLRITATVYDTKVGEYVQRHAELPISDEVVHGIYDAMKGDGGPCPIRGFGFGDGSYDKRYCEEVSSTPLKDHRRFRIDPQLHIIDEDGNVCGGWAGM